MGNIILIVITVLVFIYLTYVLFSPRSF
ncbi:MAG: potassium-transporting ATPase subunit F [bacterium]